MSKATVTVTAKVTGQPDLVASSDINVMDTVNKPMLGANPLQQTDGKDYQEPAGAAKLTHHLYSGPSPSGGSSIINMPITSDIGLLNFRWFAKVTTPTQVSLFKPILGGSLNWALDLLVTELKKVTRDILVTNHHELLANSEIAPGESVSVWGDAFVYFIDYLTSKGVGSNVKYVSCPFGSQYIGGTAQTMHTPALLERLYAVGADIYFNPVDITLPTTDLRKNRSWASFIDAYPDKLHVICESSLWNGTEAQQAAYFDALLKWYQEHPNSIAHYGFFRNDTGAGHDGRLIVPGGVNAWSNLVTSSTFDRTV